MSILKFAELGITGLRSQDAVRAYREAWQAAIDDGQATPGALMPEAVFKLDAIRKAGALLAGDERLGRGGDRRSSSGVLLDYDVDKHQSSRWQRIAGVPEPVFRAWLDGLRETGEITEAEALRLVHGGILVRLADGGR